MERIESSSLVSGRDVMVTDAAGSIQTTEQGELIVADTADLNQLYVCGLTEVSLKFFNITTMSTTSETVSSTAVPHVDDVPPAGPHAIDVPTSVLEESVDCPNDGFRWQDEAVLLLLTEYEKEEERLKKGKMSAKKFWELIAERLQEKKYEVTGGQCKSKFSGLNKVYKKVKDHNGKSGNDRRSWKFFEVMDQMFGKKPYIQPVLVVDSSEAVPSPNPSSSSSSSSGSDSEPPRKRQKKSDVEHTLVKEIQISREERRRMHEDYLARQDRLIAALEKIAEK